MRQFFFISLLGACVALGICCQKNKSTNPGTKEPGFVLQVSPQTLWVAAGQPAEFQIKLTSLNGFSAHCTLSVTGFPEGDSVAFDSEILVPTDSSRLTIFTTFSTPRDTYQLTVTAKNKDLIHSNQVILVVPTEKVTDYYPLAIGNSWTYVLLDQGGQILWDFSSAIVDTMTIGGNFGYLFSDITFIYANGDTIFDKSGGIILAGPLVIGRSWTDDFYTYELIGFETVTLTKGAEYQNCAKIKKTRTGSPGEETFEWWAKYVGKVKVAEYISGWYQGGIELESFTHP